MNPRKTNHIIFANHNQKVLWDYELSGQISDGYWSNIRPLDHWISICTAKTKVGPWNHGLNFIADKLNYNFVSTDMLSYVGDRMLDYVKMSHVTKNIILIEMAESVTDRSITTVKEWKSFLRTSYYNKNPKASKMTQKMLDGFWTDSYSMTDMKSDLRDIKKLIQKFNPKSI